MHKRNPIVNPGLLIATVLSTAIHGAALYSQSMYSPPSARIESGRTVLQLTLLPSVASAAAASTPEAESVPAPTPDPRPVATARPEPQPMAEKNLLDSSEQDSSLIEDKGVISEAHASSTIHPVYPRVSRLRGEEGVVTLFIQVLASGRAGHVEVLHSSGHRRLDESACKAARKAAFSPARQFGRTIDSTTELSFAFRLTDD